MKPEGEPDAPESPGRNLVPEEDDGPDAVVLARDPDQAINLLIGKIERLGPSGGPRVLHAGGFDQLSPGDTQTAKPKSEELGKAQVPGRAHR